MDGLEESLVPLKSELAAITANLQAEKEAGETDAREGKEAVEHRLFTHLASKEVQANIEKLVTETLDSNMSYAQVTDHLISQTSGETADILAAHPSLVKDYIRYRRQNG